MLLLEGVELEVCVWGVVFGSVGVDESPEVDGEVVGDLVGVG